MKKRKAVSKRLRFEIFARDNFTCRYCGRQSDVVVLHVDHMVPVCQGGTNDESNLITSCADCNLGKAGKTISQAVPNESDRLRMAQERNEQLAAATAAKQLVENRNVTRQTIVDYWCETTGFQSIDKKHLLQLEFVANEVGYEKLFEFIESATFRVRSSNPVDFVRYLFGCRRNWREKNAPQALEIS